MNGLVTIARAEQVISVVLAAPPVEHQLRPDIPFRPVVHFQDGALFIVTRHPAGFVRLVMATEAGRIVITDLTPQDAATAALLSTPLEGL